MFKDVLLPSKWGSTYLFTKRVVSFEVTQIAVHALLLEYKGSKSIIKNNISIALKDFSQAALVGAIKKIVATIGAYDEIVVGLSGSSVVFKELTLPFIGREKLEMIIAYEIEALLPFPLDQAVCDFIIIDEHQDKHESTLLVAAALKQDIDAQLHVFEKAGIVLQMVTVDVFGLYGLYKQGLYQPKATFHGLTKPWWSTFFKKSQVPTTVMVKETAFDHEATLYVDIGFEVVRVLYFVAGTLKSVRVIPYGVHDVVQALSKKTEIAFFDVVQDIFYKDHGQAYASDIEAQLHIIGSHIVRTQAFFENQLKQNYKKPTSIIFSGSGCLLYNFTAFMQAFFDVSVQLLDVEVLLKKLSISLAPTSKKITIDQMSQLGIVVFASNFVECNFLKTIANKYETRLWYKQIGMIFCLTMLCIGAAAWHVYADLQRWQNAYTVSKKDLVQTVQTTMGVDLKTQRSLKDILQKAEETLKQERKLWFSFSKQTEFSYLEFLQDLSVHIDRDAIGLDLKKLYMTPEKVTMTASLQGNASLNPFEALAVFAQELSELELLELVEESRDPKLFTIELKVKDRAQHDNH